MSYRDRIMKNIERVRPLSRAAEKALSALRDPDVAVPSVVDILKYDPTITATVLRYCNSAVSGARQQINSLQQAVVIIGLKQLRSLILTAAVESYFPVKPDGYEVSRLELWRHSLAVALISEDLARLAGAVPQDEAFTAGLLHDIGKVVIMQAVGADWGNVRMQLESMTGDFLAIEKDIFGISHPEVGGIILDKWKFSESIQVAARFHHDPPAPEGPLLPVHIVHMADIAAILAGWGTGLDGLHYHGMAGVFTNYGIRSSDFQLMMSRMADKVAAIEKEHFGEEKRS